LQHRGSKTTSTVKPLQFQAQAEKSES